MEKGRIYGLGANNCKGSAAVHLWLAGEIAHLGGPARGSLVFVLAGDEERLGPEGTAFLREEGIIEPDALVLGAPTENQIIIEERGVLWLEIETTGRAAHGGDPAAGDNAILRMMRLVERLRTELGPALATRRRGEKVSTMNVGTIHGGENPNVVPTAARPASTAACCPTSRSRKPRPRWRLCWPPRASLRGPIPFGVLPAPTASPRPSTVPMSRL